MAGRYVSLAHWRGAAALWVMGYHGFNVWLRDDPGRLAGWPRAFFNAGWQGVSVFFVISGYCIAERVAADWTAGRGPGRFLADRALRIYPVFWCALAGSLVLEIAALPFNFGTWRPSFTSTGILPDSFLEGVANVLLLETWFAPRSWLVVSWSLNYEIGFYLAAALALALMRACRSAWPGIILAGAAAATGLFAPRFPVLSLFPHFALGVAVWLLLALGPESRAKRNLAAAALFGAVCWLANTPGEESRASLRCAAATGAAVVLLHPLDLRTAALGPLRWLGWVGTISYSLYLVHAPIVGKARNLGFSLYPASAAGAFWVPLAACAVAVVAAAVFHHLVEAPFERLRRRLLSRPSSP
jgi:exopolysaccharide production protein ExoZ